MIVDWNPKIPWDWLVPIEMIDSGSDPDSGLCIYFAPGISHDNYYYYYYYGVIKVNIINDNHYYWKPIVNSHKFEPAHLLPS